MSNKEEYLGQEFHYNKEVAKEHKQQLNYHKLMFAKSLDILQDICSDAEMEGIEFDTFNQVLADMHLNKARVVDLIRNWRYVRDLDIPEDLWYYLDSAIIKLFRQNKKDPIEYWDDILTLSYTDLQQKINE